MGHDLSHHQAETSYTSAQGRVKIEVFSYPDLSYKETFDMPSGNRGKSTLNAWPHKNNVYYHSAPVAGKA